MIKTPNPRKPSRKILEFNTIKSDARAMSKLLRTYVSPTGRGTNDHLAIHHSQFSSDPYNFFVVNSELFGFDADNVVVIVNPKIIEKSDVKIQHEEGCMSFPFRNSIRVPRYKTITVEFQEPDATGENLISKKEVITGKMACVFQHEIEHARGTHIYVGKNSR